MGPPGPGQARNDESGQSFCRLAFAYTCDSQGGASDLPPPGSVAYPSRAGSRFRARRLGRIPRGVSRTGESPYAERVKSLAMYGATFSACENTMKGIAKKTGKEPVLLEGVKRVPAGIVRVMELQEQGCSYARP